MNYYYKAYYTTRDEIKFLNKLGTFSKCGISQSKLLLKYKKAMVLRANWDKIDPIIVANHVDRLISDYGGEWYNVS